LCDVPFKSSYGVDDVEGVSPVEDKSSVFALLSCGLATACRVEKSSICGDCLGDKLRPTTVHDRRINEKLNTCDGVTRRLKTGRDQPPKPKTILPPKTPGARQAPDGDDGKYTKSVEYKIARNAVSDQLKKSDTTGKPAR